MLQTKWIYVAGCQEGYSHLPHGRPARRKICCKSGPQVCVMSRSHHDASTHGRAHSVNAGLIVFGVLDHNGRARVWTPLITTVISHSSRSFGGTNCSACSLGMHDATQEHAVRRLTTCLYPTGWVKKSKLLILSEYVDKTEKIGRMWTSKKEQL